jgi:hypothetical protein
MALRTSAHMRGGMHATERRGKRSHTAPPPELLPPAQPWARHGQSRPYAPHTFVKLGPRPIHDCPVQNQPGAMFIHRRSCKGAQSLEAGCRMGAAQASSDPDFKVARGYTVSESKRSVPTAMNWLPAGLPGSWCPRWRTTHPGSPKQPLPPEPLAGHESPRASVYSRQAPCSPLLARARRHQADRRQGGRTGGQGSGGKGDRADGRRGGA